MTLHNVRFIIYKVSFRNKYDRKRMLYCFCVLRLVNIMNNWALSSDFRSGFSMWVSRMGGTCLRGHMHESYRLFALGWPCFSRGHYCMNQGFCNFTDPDRQPIKELHNNFHQFIWAFYNNLKSLMVWHVMHVVFSPEWKSCPCGKSFSSHACCLFTRVKELSLWEIFL